MPQDFLRWRHGVITTFSPEPGRGLRHQKWLADHACIQQRLAQSVHGVAPIIFGHSQFAPCCTRCRNQAQALLHGQGDGFLAQHMRTGSQRFHAQRHMRVGHGRKGDGVYIAAHGCKVGVDVRALTQQLLGQRRSAFGILWHQIAHAHQIHPRALNLLQLRHAFDVALPHHPAPKQAQAQFRWHSPAPSNSWHCVGRCAGPTYRSGFARPPPSPQSFVAPTRAGSPQNRY